MKNIVFDIFSIEKYESQFLFLVILNITFDI